MEHALHHRFDATGVVLYARGGVLGANRSFRGVHRAGRNTDRQLPHGQRYGSRCRHDARRCRHGANRDRFSCARGRKRNCAPSPRCAAGPRSDGALVRSAWRGRSMMQRLLLGDNQFFGINHMSEERARAQAMRFQKLDSILAVLDAAYGEGVRTFMCTTHERISEVCDYFRANRERYPDFQFYPCMPYAHKYANAATELGVLGALRSFLPDENPLKAALKGGISIARKDIASLGGMLIDAEMKMFRDLPTPAIFLQNVATDFLLGMGLDVALRAFADHVRERYGAEPGFITMNLPL